MTTPLEVDPFYRELRRRHPDIDIVLLPEVPPGSATDLAEAPPLPAQPGTVLQDLSDSFETLWAILTGLPTSSSEVPRWRAGTSDDQVFAERVGRSTGVTDGSALLLDAAAALDARSWNFRVPRGGVPRLLAEHSGRSLTISVWDDAVTLTVRSESYAVEADVKRALLRGEGS
jgi:hypothetical protein